MRANLSIYQKGILLVVVPLLFQFGFVITLTILLHESEKQLQIESDEIAKLDQVFHNMTADLIDLDKQKQELFAMVSHDLKTPLASTQGVLYLLESGGLGEISPLARERVVACEADIGRLIRLINDDWRQTIVHGSRRAITISTDVGRKWVATTLSAG